MPNEKQINALSAKVKQDKLDQRRTALSEIDQSFVNAVGSIAEEAEVDLETSISAIVENKAEAEVEEERPETTATNAVLRNFMDDQGIAYDSDDTKADYNQKIDDWLEGQQ